MFTNTICIEVEDLHAGTTRRIGQGTFANHAAATRRAAQLNDHYGEFAIPCVASVRD